MCLVYAVSAPILHSYTSIYFAACFEIDNTIRFLAELPKFDNICSGDFCNIVHFVSRISLLNDFKESSIFSKFWLNFRVTSDNRPLSTHRHISSTSAFLQLTIRPQCLSSLLARNGPSMYELSACSRGSCSVQARGKLLGYHSNFFTPCFRKRWQPIFQHISVHLHPKKEKNYF